MKKFLTLLLTVALTATLAITGTVAYLTDTDQDVNSMTMGNVKIEQNEYERADVTKSILEDGNKKAFTQAKPLYPVVGAPAWDDASKADGATYEQKAWRSMTMKNVVDKYVTVKNTGKNDAYVRTIFALEMGSLNTNELAAAISASVNSKTGAEFSGMHWIWTDDAVYTVDGQNYNIMVAVYDEKLAPNVETIPSLLQVYMKSAATNETCEKIDGNGNGTYDVIALSQAVQADGFEAVGPEAALDEAFGDVNATNVQEWFKGLFVSTPSDDDDLENDLQNPDNKTIIVNLTSDMTYDAAAWANQAMGGADTEKVIINGNGHTLTFNNTNSDWNNIVTNGAKLIINDATLTNSGHDATSGTWNAHDINFNCELELNNVTLLNAIALGKNTTLNNVDITDDSTGDAYMVWIRANGQKVTIDGCTIDATGTSGNDRGIKIDAEYISAPGKVTLIVKNTSFKTESKAAILVDTPAGADITLENIDIADVAADSTNAVWVDGDASAYADLVTVTGGSKIVEP